MIMIDKFLINLPIVEWLVQPTLWKNMLDVVDASDVSILQLFLYLFPIQIYGLVVLRMS